MAKTYEIACQRELNGLYLDALAALKKGRALRAEIKSLSSKTTAQLGWYWGVVLPRVQQGLEEQGNELSLAEVNAFLNDKFFFTQKTVCWKAGGNEFVQAVRTPRSKSGASKDEMSAFLDKVIRWAAQDLGVFIPSPDEEPPF